MSKLSFFPSPGIGETIYSIICRISARSRLPEGFIISSITGQRFHTPILSALQGYIGFISRSIPDGHIWRDAMNIVRDHTSLPYFVYFLPEQERIEWASKIATDKSSQPIAMALGLSRFPIPASPSHPRYCPQCAVEQIHQHGFSFFQRHHQLPGVLVCAEHKEILSHGCQVCGPYPIKNSSLTMPGRCLCEQSTPLPVIPMSTDITHLIWIARESGCLVNSSGTAHSDPRAVLKVVAIQKGFGRGSLIDYNRLADVIEARFGKDILQLIGMQVWINNQPASWLRGLLRTSSNGSKKPSIQLLLVVGALFDSVGDFEAWQESKEPISKGISKKSAKLNGLKILIDKNYKITDIAKYYGVGYGTVIRELRQHRFAVPLSNRMIKKFGVKLDQIRKDLISGVHKTEIMRHYGCSEEAIILIELDQPTLTDIQWQAARSITRESHRCTLLNFIKEYPDSGRSTIMTDLPTCYDYFMRVDKAWFCQQIPELKKATQAKQRKPRINWPLLDKQKSQELEHVVGQLYSCGEKPVWVTKNGLLKRIGLQSRYRANPNKFPMIGAILAKSAESYEELVSRRITIDKIR